MTRRTAFGLVIASSLGFVATGIAGKPERDKQAELKPVIARVEADLKATCGCGVKIGVKWESYATADNMFRIPKTLDDILEASKNQCSTAENKAAMCKGVASYELPYTKGTAEAELKGKTIVVGTDDNLSPGAGAITQILDKF